MVYTTAQAGATKIRAVFLSGVRAAHSRTRTLGRNLQTPKKTPSSWLLSLPVLTLMRCQKALGRLDISKMVNGLKTLRYLTLRQINGLARDTGQCNPATCTDVEAEDDCKGPFTLFTRGNACLLDGCPDQLPLGPGACCYSTEAGWCVHLSYGGVQAGGDYETEADARLECEEEQGGGGRGPCRVHETGLEAFHCLLRH